MPLMSTGLEEGAVARRREPGDVQDLSTEVEVIKAFHQRRRGY